MSEINDDWRRLRDQGLKAHRAGHHEEAARLLGDALLRLEERGFEDPELVTVLIMYGTNEVARGHLEEARQVLEECLELLQASPAGADRDLNRATCMNNLGFLARKRGELREALDLYDGGLQLLRLHKPADDPAIAATRSNMAVVYMSQERYDEAELILLEALDDENHVDRPAALGLPATVHQLVTAWIGLGKLDRAEPVLEQCVELWRGGDFPAHHSPQRSVALAILEHYVDLLRDSGRGEQAEQVLAELGVVPEPVEGEASEPGANGSGAAG